MKAPDKIWIREYPDGVARFWEEKKKDDVVATIPHEYIRKELVEHIIRASLGPQDALYKIRSL